MPGIYRGAACAGTLVLILAWATAAAGSVAVADLNVTFSGTPPAGTPPWLVATFDDQADTVGPNGVRLTLAASGLSAEEFVRQWYFNFNPALNAALLQVTPVNIGAVGSVVSSMGNDAFMADGDGLFDLLLTFPAAQAGRFTAGESVVLDLSYSAPISVASFRFSSAPGGGAGTFYSAAHVQGIAPNGSQSGWIGAVIPEPGSTALLVWGAGLAAVGLGLHRRRYRGSR